MTSGPESLSCKIQVRQYVLVLQPSRWNQRGDRVVVQSPITNITDDVSHVPVKRFSGEEDNSVCFIPRTDIEKDTSDIYFKSYVNTTPSVIDAHGVALFDSAPGDEFEYRRTDRFWIWVGPDTDKYKTTVSVINLRTYKGGSISIDHVCWYQKLQGPDEELWTLGGEKRKLNHSGARKFTSLSWVICQKLDGSTATTKNVKIFSTEVKLIDRFKLSSFQRHALFEKRLKCMLLKQLAMRDHSMSREPASRTPPPLESDEPENKEQRIALEATTISPSSVPRTAVGWWHGILDMAGQRKGPPTCPSGSSIYLPKLQGNHASKASKYLQQLRCNEVARVSKDSMPGTMTISLPRTFLSFQASDRRLFNRELGKLDGHEKSGISDQADTGSKWEESYRNSINELGAPPAFSVTDPGIMNGSTSIAQLYHGVKATKSYHDFQQVSIASLCDLKRPDCKYSRLIPEFHYHSPTAKCHASEAIGDRPHEHCISKDFALPGRAGGCILITFPSRAHTCCHWRDEDRLEWESAMRRKYQDTKADEIMQHKQDIIDMSEIVREIPREVEADLGFVELLNEAGRQILADDMHWSGG
jgi:hypothetical protein